ncbi:iron-sulfur cluster carrier protein MrpORP [Anoxynatronum sibiricum]|uniref:Iron-sulfur cluster carrier protein n=1 Tax=Anoxynatronum sibiricum TaxID=210623 RepID=A0ABU9VP37_9CLOT
MNEACDQSCGSCNEACDERKTPYDMKEQPHAGSQIQKVIGVVSGKGGVGKSLVTSLLAVSMNRRGYRTAILDADVTGPSIPKAFGITGKAMGSETGIFPIASETGIKLMSINLLLPNDTDPVVWRGPLIAGTVKQFWTDVIWGEVDYLFVDMPPGTGDVPLTVFQSLPVDGIVIVTSPQELVSMIVEKAVRMAEMMQIPVLGLVENMAWFQCPSCDTRHYPFGESHLDMLARRHGLKLLASLPIDPAVAAACDQGAIEKVSGEWLEELGNHLERADQNEGVNGMKIAVASDGTQVSGHFGHCEAFHIFETDAGKVLREERVANPGHRPGFLPQFLHEQGVNVIVSGGMGGGAVDLFRENGIEVVTGAVGEAREVVSMYLQGQLSSNGSVCHEHAHEGTCGH